MAKFGRYYKGILAMNNLKRYLIILVLILSDTVIAQNLSYDNACDLYDDHVVIGFFNGVNTTFTEANLNLQALVDNYGNETSDAIPIRYELFYNDTDGLYDFVETFAQRAKEKGPYLQDNFAMVWDLLGAAKWWRAIASISRTFEDLFLFFNSTLKDITVLALEKLINNNTEKNYAAHNTRVSAHLHENGRLLFVAHSQGNLFANHAYEYAKSQIKGKIEDYVQAVHVAPTSIKTNGPHVLADLDLVIKPLMRSPNSNMSIPVERKPGVGGATDWKGHSFLAIYMNKHLKPRQKIIEHINDSTRHFFNKIMNLPKDASYIGFVTATLTWDGKGDVDLHIFEPNGTHVYFNNKLGTSGILDVDNVEANGPEHYFLSCAKSQIQTGTYQFKIANYEGATGRNATVQIATFNDGVRATKTIKLGDETDEIPTYHMFDVNVIKNIENNLVIELQ